MKKFLIYVVVILVVVALVLQFTYPGGVVGSFMDLGMRLTSGMKHRDPATEQANFTLAAKDFSAEFKADNAKANTKYINKSVLLNGSITAIDSVKKDNFSIDNVVCVADSTDLAKISSLKVGDEVKVQGLVVGYNDMMEEINLSQCRVK